MITSIFAILHLTPQSSSPSSAYTLVCMTFRHCVTVSVSLTHLANKLKYLL